MGSSPGIAAEEPVRDQRPASPSAPPAPTPAVAHAPPVFRATPVRPADPPPDDPLAATLARAVQERGARLQRKKKKEESWLDSLWDTVGDVIGEIRKLSAYPRIEPLPKPGLGDWYGSDGLEAIRDRKGLLSKTKLPRGDKTAPALVRQAVRAWGAQTYQRNLLPTWGSSKFDAEADAAVRHLQRHAGLTDDGVVGPMTLAVLDDYITTAEDEDDVVTEFPEVGGLDPNMAPITDAPLEAGFDEEELRWIDEVWTLPPIQALFGLYPSMPRPVLDRLEQLRSWKDESPHGSRGVAHEGEYVDIASNTYRQHDGWNKGNREAQFKSVMIHELFHLFEHWSESSDPPLTVRRPHALVEEMGTLPFGWFEHPTVRVEDEDGTEYPVWCHFGWGKEAFAKGKPYELKEYSPLYWAWQNPSSWENSPDLRDPEEDVSTCLGTYLTSQAGKEHLKTKFPKRFKLVDDYVSELMTAAERSL